MNHGFASLSLTIIRFFALGYVLCWNPNRILWFWGEAETGRQAVQMAISLQPDVVLMDINMPELNGIDATQQISKGAPNVAVLIITMFDDDTVFTAMQSGARGYLLKGAKGDETLRAIRAVANGEVIFSPGVAEQMMAYFAKSNDPNTGCALP